MLYWICSSSTSPLLQSLYSSHECGRTTFHDVIEETVYDEIQLPAAFICYRMPAQNSDDFYAVQMLTQVLSGGSSSRLNKSVVEKQELAVTAFSFPFPLEHPGMALILGIASAGVEVQDLRKAMDKKLNYYKTN
jgi:zinc protease